MCLNVLDPKITIRSGIGYKFVKGNLTTYRSRPHWCKAEPVQLKMDEWVHDSKPLKELLQVSQSPHGADYMETNYKPGFHLNLTETDAMDCARDCGWYNGRVVKVRFHHVVAQGEQNGFPVIVARCIKVVK